VDTEPAGRLAASGSSRPRLLDGRVVAVVVGVTLLVTAAGQGLSLAGSLLQPPAVQRLDDQDRDLRCLRAEVEHSIPAGASVYVPPDPRLWDQRVIESTYPRYRFVSRRTQADYAVRVVPDRQPCASRVSVERLR
jgi:hypothetical protein